MVMRVLDSWAVIELLDGTHVGAAASRAWSATQPVMSWINVGEVSYIVERRHGRNAAAEAVAGLRSSCTLDPVTPDRILEASRIKASYRMSYADAFAAATAIAHRAELWTGDPELLVDGAPWRWHDLRQAQ